MRARFNLRCVVDGQISGDSPPNIPPPAASLNMSTPGCRHNSRARPRRRDRLEEAFSNRPRDGNRQPTNSCLFPAGMAPGKRERGLGATRLVPNDPFCPLPIRGRHGNEPRLPEAREMGRRQSPLPNPPSSPSQEDLSHAGPGGAWRGGSTRCQLSEKRSYMARVPCVTRPARFPVLDWKKHTPLESPHVPCLRLIDRAGGPPLRHQRAEGGKVCLSTLDGQRPPGSVDPLLANCLEAVAQHT